MTAFSELQKEVPGTKWHHLIKVSALVVTLQFLI